MNMLESRTGPRWTTGLFVLLATLWGASFVAIEVGLEFFPPLYFAGVRYLVAGLVLGGYAWMTAPQFLPRDRNGWLTVLIIAAFIIFGNHAFLYIGQQYIPGPVAAVVISLSPVLTVVFASFALGHGLPRVHEVLGFGLGLAGVVVIAQPDPNALASSNLIGIGLVFLAAVSFALGGVLTRPFRTDMPIESIQGLSMVLGAVMLVAVGAVRGETLSDVDLTVPGAVALAYLTVFSGVIAFLLYFTLLDRVGPTQLNLVGYAEPVAASIMGWLVLGQVVGPATVGGFVLIVLGFTFIQRDLLVRLVDDSLPRTAAVIHKVGDEMTELRAVLRRASRYPRHLGKW